MLSEQSYRLLNENQYYIDKTGELELGLENFPSIYVEGAAASGKTTAVKMLLEKHPEVKCYIFDMEEVWESEVLEKALAPVADQMKSDHCWIVCENMNTVSWKGTAKVLADFVSRMPDKGRVIFVGRERPAEELLGLLWEGKMELLPQEVLLFHKEDIRNMISETQSILKADAVYEQTGGWAGCVQVMIQLAAQHDEYKNTRVAAEELRSSYEIDRYIRHTILDAFSQEEQAIVEKGKMCPWLDPALCSDIWGINEAEDSLRRLGEKGIFTYHRERKRWKLAKLFQYQDTVKSKSDRAQMVALWTSVANWYEAHGYLKEAVVCLEKTQDEVLFYDFIIRHFEQITLMELPLEKLHWKKEDSPQNCYLRAMHAYACRDFKGLDEEIDRLEKMAVSEEGLKKEVLLNLYYMKPDMSMDDWLRILESEITEGRIRLYNMLGGSHTFLCGLRDLTGLFACEKKEENRKAGIWKSRLGEEEWISYQLARVDYYLETQRQEVLLKEDQELLQSIAAGVLETADLSDMRFRQFSLATLYLYMKMQCAESELIYRDQLQALERRLADEESMYARSAEALQSLYSPWLGDPQRLTRWLRYMEEETKAEVNEQNYMYLTCIAKGYLFLNQCEKAGRILKRLVAYLKEYRRTRFQAEMIFQQAVVNWELGLRGQALQNVIESFLVSGNSRYVGFYTSYGVKGQEVLETYVDWMKQNAPKGWSRKKKYNYGNVVRMPIEDYLEVILRCVKREIRDMMKLVKQEEEALTMMETVILQDISQGLTNIEICEEQNLKMSTVKSHIYNLYKKLGVNSRVQAILKGKELGIIR